MLVKPHGVLLSANGQALAADTILLLQKGGGIFIAGILLKERHNALNAVVAVAAAGKNSVCHRIRDTKDRQFYFCLLLFLCLGLGNALDLFLHRGKQAERGDIRLLRRRNGGLSARRLSVLLIYL